MCVGYEGIFKKRTGDKEDGCATFWKEDKFVFDKGRQVEYCVPETPVLNRDNVALLVLLTPNIEDLHHKSEFARLCIANTHLLYNPRRGDVKLAQSMLLMAEVEKFAFVKYSVQTGEEMYYPILLCGDFNCLSMSHLYKFFVKGRLNYKGLPQRDISGQEDGRYGRKLYMPRQIIPNSLGINDNCQYIRELRERSEEFKEYYHKYSEVLKAVEEAMRKDGVDDHEERDDDKDESDKKDAYDDHEERDNDKDESDKKDAYDDHEERDDDEKDEHDDFEVAEDITIFKEPSYAQCDGVVSHNIKFNSVYRPRKREAGQVNYLKNFESMPYDARVNFDVDFIFYSQETRKPLEHKFYLHGLKHFDVESRRLHLLEYMEMPAEKRMRTMVLPNEAVSSDHMILMAKFLLSLKNTKPDSQLMAEREMRPMSRKTGKYQRYLSVPQPLEEIEKKRTEIKDDFFLENEENTVAERKKREKRYEEKRKEDSIT